MAVEFGVLGTIEACADGRALDIGHVRQRCVLAALLVDANRAVAADDLIDRVWRDRAPQEAKGTLYSYLSRLRQALRACDGDARIVRRPGGYAIEVDPAAVDLHRFRDLVARARAAGEEQAAASMRQALGLWRGEAFATVDTPWFADLRRVLERERFAAELDSADIGLRRGLHGELLPTLTARAQEHPLDERLTGQLMLAFYRGGRPADALTCYRGLRRRLAQETGTEPGAPLRHLHQEILTGAATLAHVPPEAAAGGATSVPTPRQLPARPYWFTGRDAQLAELDKALIAPDGPRGTAVISAIGGSGGMGKTWLALHWAHLNLDRFPDGQLYVDLRGFDPSGEPLPTAAGVRGFLDALGVDPGSVPADVRAQVGLYRGLTAGKRLLVVLDNARDTAQVAPLLPGGSTCTVLVTSRNRLTGLAAAHGACPLSLDVLTGGEARHLLTLRLGAERVAAEAGAATALLDHCAGLPLAVSILAARATTQPALTLAALTEELDQAQTRLDALEAGDLTADLRAVFATSYRALAPETARVFRLLGLAPGPDTGLPAAAGLTGLPTSRTRAILRDLHSVHLVQEHTPGRYRMHDLIRLYAAERARQDSTPRDRALARRRLADFYLHTARAAVALVDPRRETPAPPTPAPTPAPAFPDYDQAVAWLEKERENLAACVHLAGDAGLHPHAWHLPAVLWPFYFLRGYLSDWISTHQAALAALAPLDDDAAHADTLHNLAIGLWQCARYTEAAEGFEQAVELRGRLGDTTGVAASTGNLAVVCYYSGRYEAALTHGLRSLELRRQVGDPRGEAVALTMLSGVLTRVGRLTRALEDCDRARTLFHQAGDQHGEASCLINLSTIHERLGRYAEALDFARRGLAAVRELGHRGNEVRALSVLAAAHTAQGEHRTALEHHRQALRTAEGLADPGTLATIHIEHALSLHAAGRPGQAADHYRTGLGLAEQAKDPYERARAHQGLAAVLAALGDSGESARHRRHAGALFADLRIPPVASAPPARGSKGP